MQMKKGSQAYYLKPFSLAPPAGRLSNQILEDLLAFDDLPEPDSAS